MLSIGNLSTQVQFKALLQKPQHFSIKPQFLFFTHLNYNAKLTSGVCLKSSKAKKNADFIEIEMDGSDEFDDDEFFDDVDDDEYLSGDDDDIEDEVIVPLENMKKWVENKPLGFGEGKDYDTSIEDKLMEEIEHSRTVQLANVNKLKHNPIKPGSEKDSGKKDKVPVNIPDGFGVRLMNLPKKKNIHRDLKLAFKGVPGLLNIVPLVAGNEKTRDPICKGLAFVYFKSQDEARRFVKDFSDQNISFGKNQKKITCELMDRKLPKPQRDPPVVTKQLKVRSSDEHLKTVLKKVNLVLNTQKPSSSKEPNDAEEMSSLVLPKDDDTESDIDAESSLVLPEDDETESEVSGISSTPNSNVVIDLKPGKDFTSNSTPLKKERKPKPDKKKVSKPRKGKSPKLTIPGSSSSRLKVRDKAMLTDVFSKYGSGATATVTQNSS